MSSMRSTGRAFVMHAAVVSACAIAITTFLGASVAQDAAASAPAAAKAKIEDFAWLIGRWTGELKIGRTEEIWTRAEGGAMVGTFRLISGEGKTSVIELMMLRQVGDSVEMRFRHFSDDLTAWEPVDQPAVMRLAKFSKEEIVFVDPTPEKPKKGQPLRQVWRYQAPDQLDFEVYVARDNVEKLALEGKTRRVAMDAP